MNFFNKWLFVLLVTITSQAFAIDILLDTTDDGNGIVGETQLSSIGGIDVSGFHEIQSLSGGFAKGTCEALTVIKLADGSTPAIINAVISGQQFDTITAYFFGNDPDTGEVLLEFKMTLHDPVIANANVNLEKSSFFLFEQLTIIPSSISVMDSSGGTSVASCQKVK